MAVAEANTDVYREKAVSHWQEVPNAVFVWPPDTLFQSYDISFGTSLSCRKYG